jgi:hypothetical protein
MRFSRFLTLLCVVSIPALSQTTLSGNIGGLTLEASGNPYLVTENLTIPEGKRLIIKQDCVILFKSFTGLIVNGALVVEGTLDKPVIFTSENDDRYNPQSTQLPNPFDWNGILISPQASNVKLSNFVLEYSVYGVKSQKDEFIINNGTFSRNGQFHVTVGDQIENVVEDIPFNFGIKAGQVKKADQPVTPRSWYKPVAIVAGVTGVASLGVSSLFFSRMVGYTTEYNSAATNPAMADATRKGKSVQNAGVACAVAGGLLLTTGVVILVWNHRTASSAKITAAPILGAFNGITISLIL